MGCIGNEIIQSRVWIDPTATERTPQLNYKNTFPITVYDAIRESIDDPEHSQTLREALDYIYKELRERQQMIPAKPANYLMTYAGVEGGIGSIQMTNLIPTDPKSQRHDRIPTEKAVANFVYQLGIDGLKVSWDDIPGKPNIYQELGDDENGLMSQKVISEYITNLHNKIVDSTKELQDVITNTTEGITDHLNSVNNPHNVTCKQIGAATKEEVDLHVTNSLNPHHVTVDQIGAVSKEKFDNHINSDNPHGITKFNVGLGNVDNTSDKDKPISTATQNALNDINSSIDNINNDIKTITDNISDIDTKLTDSVTEINGNIEKVNVKIEDIKSTINTSAESINTEIESLKQTSSEHSNSITKLGHSVEEHGTQLQDLSDSCDDINNTIDELKKSVADVNEEINNSIKNLNWVSSIETADNSDVVFNFKDGSNFILKLSEFIKTTPDMITNISFDKTTKELVITKAIGKSNKPSEGEINSVEVSDEWDTDGSGDKTNPLENEITQSEVNTEWVDSSSNIELAPNEITKEEVNSDWSTPDAETVEIRISLADIFIEYIGSKSREINIDIVQTEDGKQQITASVNDRSIGNKKITTGAVDGRCIVLSNEDNVVMGVTDHSNRAKWMKIIGKMIEENTMLPGSPSIEKRPDANACDENGTGNLIPDCQWVRDYIDTRINEEITKLKSYVDEQITNIWLGNNTMTQEMTSPEVHDSWDSDVSAADMTPSTGEITQLEVSDEWDTDGSGDKTNPLPNEITQSEVNTEWTSV